MIRFQSSIESKHFKPLDQITIMSDFSGIITVNDGHGRTYVQMQSSPEVIFTVGGALGRHTVYHKSVSGEILGELHFYVDCETSVEENEFYKKLIDMLYFTMGCAGEKDQVRFKGKIYNFFVRWIRDHSHVLKGMKYFEDDLKSAIELYRDSQRQDGMIWDNVYPRGKDLTYFEQILREGNFMMPTDDRKYEFRRMPVEADVEYLYIEGIYNTWRATGDDDWMKSMIDSGLKAIEYDLTSPYRWSQKYQLVKRGFTIDTWDFQSWIDVEKSGHITKIDLDKTDFGIMHGDNTGLAQSCFYLSTMLEQIGRFDEAQKYAKLSQNIKKRLDEVAWNGSFYTHHIPENENVDRSGLGGKLHEQISLSNTYALNRGLNHEQCTAIIRQYIKIKDNLPQGSAGEWYTIYPPFENFNNDHSAKWEYMNGSVITIAAGELAKGAFENGYEKYGVDILHRISQLADRHEGYLHCAYRGEILPRPRTSFETVDLSTYINIDFYSKLGIEEAPELIKWDERDLDQKPIGLIEYDDIPFHVMNCICLSNTDKRHHEKVSIPINRKAQSIYLLHVMSGSSPCGLVTIEYEDGTKFNKYLNEYKEAVRWYQPEREIFYAKHMAPNMRVVWQGKNNVCDRVGIGAYCFDNPNPEKVIKTITLSRMENGSVWYVMGITLSDQKAYFTPDDVSFGIPDSWGAAAVVYSLIEGLAGVVDEKKAFEEFSLSPRWMAAGVNKITTTVKYPASKGYVSYKFRHQKEEKQINLKFTGSGNKVRVHLLMPEECEKIEDVRVNGSSISFTATNEENSLYADLSLPEGCLFDVTVIYQ